VDYAATALDVAIQAYANVGADIRRFAVTGRLVLPLSRPPRPRPDSIDQGSREGRSGVSALGQCRSCAATLYLLKQAGADAQKVQFATMGVNLLEALPRAIDVGLCRSRL